MFDTLIQESFHVFTPEGALALLNIILIDLVMSGDNAILIGMATRNLQGPLRKKAILWGVLGATILRIIFSGGVVWLLKIPGLEFLGALLLLYVVWKFYREIRSSEEGENGHHTNAHSDLWNAVKTIIIADVAMSLDNVLAVAGASHGNLFNLAIGLVISIILMVVASSFIAKLLEKYPSIQWAGLFIILFTALDMLEKGMSVAPIAVEDLLSGHIFLFLLFVVVALFGVLQAKYLKADHSVFAEWTKKNGRILMITNFILLLILTTAGGTISEFISSHHGYYYGIIMIAVLGILEVLRLKEPKDE
ncbi:MAG: TerC family protein [Candidatus Peregrinibacteria bacterium]